MDDRPEDSATGLDWPERYQALRARITEQWGVSGDIYLTRQLSGGKSGALVYLTDITSSDFTGQAILKFDHGPDPALQEKSEADQLLRAFDASPIFAERHLPRMLHTAHDEESVAILSSVAGRGLEYARAWTNCDHVEQIAVAKRLSRSLLEEWNCNAVMTRGLVTPQTLLRSWLGHRLDPVRGRLDETASQICGIAPEEPSFVFDGQWFPNPLAFALAKREDFAHLRLRAIEGHIHGDLHGMNILVNRTGEQKSEYYLIDLAFYQDRQFLFYDHAYLALSHLLERRSHVTESHWGSVVTELCPFDHLRQPTRIDGDDLGLIDLLKMIRTEVFAWVDRHQSHRLSYMESQFQLAQVAVGLNFANKRIAPKQRRFAFLYAAFILKDYILLHDVKWPRHGPPLSSDENVEADAAIQPRRLDPSDASQSLDEAPPLPENPAIAVLAFEDLSPGDENDYFVDGITDELITELSRVDWLMVISRGSTFEYKGQSPDPRKVGRDLGVHYVVEGSVLRAGDRIRINAKLVDAKDGGQIWAERFEQETHDLFELQKEVSVAIAARIESHLKSTERKLAKLKTGSITSWEGFQKAMWHYHKFTEEDSSIALRQLAELSGHEFANSGVYAALALLQMRKLLMGDVEDVDALLKTALSHATKAVELEERSSFARAALGRVYSMQGRFDQAIEEADLSLALNPSFSLGYLNLSASLLWGGCAEDALPAIERSMRLSPRGPMLRVKIFNKGSLQYFLSDYDAAEHLFNRAQTSRVLAPFARMMLAANLLRQDRLEEAKSAMAAALEARPHLSMHMAKRSWKTLASNYRTKLFGDLQKAGLPD